MAKDKNNSKQKSIEETLWDTINYIDTLKDKSQDIVGRVYE